MKKRKVLVLAPKPDDGTSWWRAAGPLSALDRMMRDEDGVEFTLGDSTKNKYGWSDLAPFDAIFYQRPYNAASLNLATMIKDMGKKLWLDYDDNLVDIPRSNRAHKTFEPDEIKRNFSKILALSDVISVTNDALKRAYEPVQKKIVVIPNGLNDFVFQNKKKLGEKELVRIIAWRGSRTHEEDLETYMPAFKQIADEHLDWKFLFIGHGSWRVDQGMPATRTYFMDPVPLPKFFDTLNILNARIAMVPLFDHTFNHCKSNIAWQEFTYAGAAVLAPDWDTWRLPGVTGYCGTESFYLGLKKLVQDKELCRWNAAESHKHLQSAWLESHMNAMRRELVLELLG